MTYKLCLKLVKLGKNIADKIDVFYAAGRLTEDEYSKLIAMIREG